MSSATNHSIQEEMESVAPFGAPNGTSSKESHEATPSLSPLEHQPTVLLSQTKNQLETIYREAREETIVNGKYVLDSEDDTYLYCYYQTTYRVKVMKDTAKSKINYRDSQGRLLPGYSLVKAVKSEDTVVAAKRKGKKYTKKTAERYLEQELLADLISEIKTGDLTDKERVAAKLALVPFVKHTLTKVQTEKTIKVVGDDFDDAEIVDETLGEDQD